MDSDHEDDIRPPDNVIRERLIFGNDYNSDDDMDKAIYESIQSNYDFELNEVLKISKLEIDAINQSYEEAEKYLINEFNKEKKRRTELFKPIMAKLLQLKTIDKTDGIYYECLENIYKIENILLN